MTRMHNVVTKSGHETFLEQYPKLNEHEKSMFAELEQDWESAVRMCKPLLAIFKNRGGKFTFVVLREGTPLSQEHSRSHRLRSNLALDQSGSITLEVVTKLISLLKLKTGALIDDIDHLLPGIDSEHYAYTLEIKPPTPAPY